MAPKHFVQLRLGGNKTYKDLISTDDCSYVAEFKDAIKKMYSRLLSDYDTAQLTLLQPDGITEIDTGEDIARLSDFGVGAWTPLIVTVEEPPGKGSSTKQIVYNNGLSVESTCRKFFDALAKNLANYYRFQWGPDDDNDYPTFGDVLYAYTHNRWNYIRRQSSYEPQRTDETGFTTVAAQVPLLAVPLPDLFHKDEWTKLKEWNKKTNSRIHDADLPKTSTGKYFVIIPHDDYNQQTISFFKTIGAKGRLYTDESKLVVRDEGDLSGKLWLRPSVPDV